MKLFKLTLMLSVLVFSFVSCGGDEDIANDGSSNGGNGKSCESNADCPLGYTCDTEKNICSDGSENSEGGNSGNNSGSNSSEDSTDSDNNGDTSDSGSENQGPITGNCTPGDSQKCEYQGAPETEGVGPCKAAKRVCKEDGTWGKCEDGYEPVIEIDDKDNKLCSDHIDNDCDGEVDNGTDFDGDGHGACSDCCESTETCPSPKDAWDPEIHICAYGEEISNNCDSEIDPNSTDPMDYAKAIGLCKTTTEDSNDWGVISADITAPDGSAKVHEQSHGLLSKLGNEIKPQAKSKFMLGLSSGKVTDPLTKYECSQSIWPQCKTITSGAPSDWLNEQIPKGSFPAAGSCDESGTSGNVNDGVMLTLKIRAPKTAKSFSFNIYFLTIEYPEYICSKFNDFFIALLDSSYTSSDPNLQNPKDKNLAMDANNNPVGVNLAPSGLFTQCSPVTGYPKTQESCKGTGDLQGTGFEGHGGTGWLTTRGNVKGGEIITLRLAIWDLTDDRLDSLVLIDNFKWETTEQKPGTGNY